MIDITIVGTDLIMVGVVLYIIGMAAVFVSDDSCWDKWLHYVLYLIPCIATMIAIIGLTIAVR